MTNGRPVSKSPGRTPPFILVGLLVLLCVLAYNYWTLSAKNADLTAMTERLQLEAKSVSSAHDSVQRSLEETQEKLRVTEGNLDHVRQILKEKEGEVENLRNDMTNLQTEQSKCTEDLAKCDSDLEKQGQKLETVAAEKKKLEIQLAEQRGPSPTCTFETCINPIRKIMSVVGKLIDTPTLIKTLEQEKIDADLVLGLAGDSPDFNAKLMDPLGRPPPLEGNQPHFDSNSNAEMDIKSHKLVDDVRQSEKEAGQVVGKTESTGLTNAAVSSSPAEGGPAKPLLFQPGDKKSVEKMQMGEDGKETVGAPAEVIKQNVDGDLKGKEEATSSQVTAGLDTEKEAKDEGS